MPLQGLYVQYYREPSPPRSAWRTDLPRIAAAGFAGIQLRPQWRWHEREEGRFTWDELHELCDLAAENRLRVVVQFIAEMAPDWFLQKYRPYRCDLSGALRPPGAISAMYVGGWEPCYDHPATPEFASRFIAEGVHALKRHACIEAWHVWNEPRSRPNWDCGCPHSVHAYQDWLRQRYGTIEKLNEVTGKAWGSFDAIIPPTLTSDYTEIFLWRTWAVQRVAPRVAWAAAAARNADPSRPVWSHVGFAVPGQNPLNDGSPDWLTARTVDRYGLSMPLRGDKIGEVNTDRWPFAASMLNDWIRCISPDGKYHAWEIYPDLGLGIQGVPAEQFGTWLWQAAASGPERICIWQYRSERIGTESGDAGLVEVDGSDKPHRVEASRFIEKWNERREVLDALQPAPPKVWIAYDFASHLLWHVEQAGDAQYLFGPGPAHTPRPQSPTRMTLYRWYHIFRQAGFEVGWLSCDNLEAGHTDLPPHDCLIVLPSLYMLSQETAARLADWTRAGGRLLVVAGTASRGPNTFVNEQPPGAALADLLGLTEAPYRWSSEAQVRLPLQIGSVPQLGPVWPLAVARIQPGRAQHVIATWPDGSPAALLADSAQCATRARAHAHARPDGAGRAIWLGAALDVDDASTTAAAERLIPSLLEYLDLQPQIGVVDPAWPAGWLSCRTEFRLAVHPRQGQFLWVFTEPGTAIHLRHPQWPSAFDWLSGQPITTPDFTASYRILCISGGP